MRRISMIAAIDEAQGLGKDDNLLCHLPADLQHFKNLTMGKPIIMGRKTYESIGRPLPGRYNIIVSRTQKPLVGAHVVTSLSQALALKPEAVEVMVIGGASIYEQAFSKAEKIYLTLIHNHFAADVFFPPINPLDWRCTEKKFRQRDEKNKYDMTFYCYERIST